MFNTYKRMRKHLFNTHKDVCENYRVNTRLEEFTDSSIRLDISSL